MRARALARALAVVPAFGVRLASRGQAAFARRLFRWNVALRRRLLGGLEVGVAPGGILLPSFGWGGSCTPGIADPGPRAASPFRFGFRPGRPQAPSPTAPRQPLRPPRGIRSRFSSLGRAEATISRFAGAATTARSSSASSCRGAGRTASPPPGRRGDLSDAFPRDGFGGWRMESGSVLAWLSRRRPQSAALRGARRRRGPTYVHLASCQFAARNVPIPASIRCSVWLSSTSTVTGRPTCSCPAATATGFIVLVATATSRT